jgi:hypothetical protein
MRPCTRRIAPAEVDTKATSIDADLGERAPWCRTAPDALNFTSSLYPPVLIIAGAAASK